MSSTFSPVLPDHLWVGPAPGPEDLAELEVLGITAVLSVIHPTDGYDLPASIRQRFTCDRLPIVDALRGGVPTVEDLANGVEILRRWRREGHRIYLHCLEGKGRSPLVAMAYLVVGNNEERNSRKHRLTSVIAHVKRARPIADPNIFQIKVLCDYVVHALNLDVPVPLDASHVVEAEGKGKLLGAQGNPTLFDRFSGSMLGLATGDALGTTLEFKSPGSFKPLTDMVGGGPFNLKPGQWTDDMSMALCLAESLFERHGFAPDDQMQRYLRWYRDGDWSSTGTCFDIGNTVREALEAFERSNNPYSGPPDPSKAGNGSLMRLAPVPLFFHQVPDQAMDFAAESSRTTHGAPAAVDACRYYAGLIIGALQGRSKEELLAPHFSPVSGALGRLCPEVDKVAAGSFKRKAPPKIRGTGYVVHALEAALWAFYTTESFEAGALQAVNLGEDADTTGAIYGQLAGAYYGVKAIPEHWRRSLAMREDIDELIDCLYQSSLRATKALEQRPPLTFKRAIESLEAMCISPEWAKFGYGPGKPLSELLYESQLGSFSEAHFASELVRLLGIRDEGSHDMTLRDALDRLIQRRRQHHARIESPRSSSGDEVPQDARDGKVYPDSRLPNAGIEILEGVMTEGSSVLIKAVLDGESDANAKSAERLLYEIQAWSGKNPGWIDAEALLDRLVHQLLPADILEVVGDSWWLEIGPVDLGAELIAIHREEDLVAVIAPRVDGRLRVATFRPLDARSAGMLIGLGLKPHQNGTVAMRPNNWEYALDCSAPSISKAYAQERKESYLAYWQYGFGRYQDGSETVGSRAINDLDVRPSALTAVELRVHATHNPFRH